MVLASGGSNILIKISPEVRNPLTIFLYLKTGMYRGRFIMKYKIIHSTNHLIIEISGDTIKNEALLVKKQLGPYLRRIGIMVIIDLSGLEECEPAVILGVLNGIKKEVGLNYGELKLCSLIPEIEFYFKENRLDRMFNVYEDLGRARESQREKT
jgi:anti-anti-sigma regulatory factor